MIIETATKGNAGALWLRNLSTFQKKEMEMDTELTGNTPILWTIYLTLAAWIGKDAQEISGEANKSKQRRQMSTKAAKQPFGAMFDPSATQKKSRLPRQSSVLSLSP